MLVYAHSQRFAQHDRALRWLKHLAEGNLPWGIPVFCLGEFVRVVTHPRVLDPPSTIDEALAALDGLLQSPTVRVLVPGPSYASLVQDAVRAGDARGNLAFDAQIAAVCREQGVSKLLTLDRDFARFPGIQTLRLDSEPESEP